MFICYSEEFKCRYCLDVFVERQRPLLLHKKYLGSAHSLYNLKYKENIYILVIGLNVSRFNNDSVLLIIAEKLKIEFDVLGRTPESIFVLVLETF